MYYTTLNKIRERRPCREGWEKLLKSLNKKRGDNEPLHLKVILDSNGVNDALWALRTLDDPRIVRLFTVRCVRQVQHFLIDERSIRALDVAERFAIGEASDEELRFAWGEARRAVWDALGRAETQEETSDTRWAIARAAHAACATCSRHDLEDAWAASGQAREEQERDLIALLRQEQAPCRT